MSSRLVAIFGLFGVLTGFDLMRDTMKRHPRPGELRTDMSRIASECRIPVRWIRVIDDRTIGYAPDPGSDLKRMTCVLSETRKLPYKFQMGFVGNEAYSENKQ